MAALRVLPAGDKVDNDVTALLLRLLQRARAGEIESAAVAFVTADGDSECDWAVAPGAELHMAGLCHHAGNALQDEAFTDEGG